MAGFLYLAVVLSGILNRNGLVTGNGNRWTRERVTSLRSPHRILVHKPAEDGVESWLQLNKAAQFLHIAAGGGSSRPICGIGTI
jgi:hypothetical protein